MIWYTIEKGKRVWHDYAKDVLMKKEPDNELKGHNMKLDTDHRFGAGEGIVGLREIVRIRAICCREYGGLTTFHTTADGYYFQGPSYTTPYDKHMELAILAAVGNVKVCESNSREI